MYMPLKKIKVLEEEEEEQQQLNERYWDWSQAGWSEKKEGKENRIMI